MVMLVSLLQLEKAKDPMLVKLSGRVMLVSLLQYAKVYIPRPVTPLGIVMSVRPVQP